jgi:hypothetical protein
MTPNPTELAKLTKEIAELNPAVPDWHDVDELAAVAYEIPNPKPESKPIRLDYGQCVDLYKALDKEIKERQARMEPLKDLLQAALMVSGKKKVKAGDHFCQMVEKAGSRKIVAEKLLAKGVSAQVIAESTEIGRGSTYLQIRAVGEDK